MESILLLSPYKSGNRRIYLIGKSLCSNVMSKSGYACHNFDIYFSSCLCSETIL